MIQPIILGDHRQPAPPRYTAEWTPVLQVWLIKENDVAIGWTFEETFARSIVQALAEKADRARRRPLVILGHVGLN